MLFRIMAAKLTKRYYDSKFYSSGATNVPTNFLISNHRWTSDLTDDRTDGGLIPNWRERIRDHKAATTTINGRRWTVKRSPGNGVLQQLLRGSVSEPYTSCPVYWQGYPWPTRVSGVASGAVITDGVADRVATKKFFQKYTSLTQGSDGLVSLGELRETLRMLRNPAEALMKAIRGDYLDAVKRHKKLSPRSDPDRWKKALSGLWLEHAFGWLPLVNDVRKVLDALDLYNAEPIVTRMITAVGKQTQAIPAVTEHFWSPDNHDLWFSGTEKHFLRQKVKYRGAYVRSRTEIKALSQSHRAAEAFGLTLPQFVPAAWELLPWSFLVDYFTNIGDILEQSFVDLRNLAWCNKTVVNDGVYELAMPLHTPLTKSAVDSANFSKYNGHSEGAVAQLLITRRHFTRGPGGPAVSRLQFEIPSSPMKWLNMTALAVQANAIHPQKHFVKR